MSDDSGKFIGRQRELDQFRDSLNRLTRLGRLRAWVGGRSGDPPRVFLPHGIGGIGKTKLTQQCLGLAHDQGWKTIELKWDMVNLRPNEPLDLMNAIAEDLRDQYGDRMMVDDYLEARRQARAASQKVDRVKAENQQKWQEFVAEAEEATRDWVGGSKGKAAGLLVRAGGAVVGAGAASLAQAEEAFCKWAIGQGQLDHDDMLLYQRGDQRLADRLVKALVKAARKQALVVGFDTCEALPVELEEWLRDAIVCPAVREPAPLLFIVAGRIDQFSERRQETAEGRQITVKGYADHLTNPPPAAWDMTRLAEPEVRDYLAAHGLPADAELLELAQTISRGIPYALWVFADTVRRRGPETARALFPLDELSGLSYKELVTVVTRRFLGNCLDDEVDQHRIYALALLRHPDPDAAAALWDLPQGTAARAELARLEARYAFAGIDGHLHDVVAEFARDELRYSERARANQLGRRAADHYGPRWQTLTEAIPHLGDRLDDQPWRELTLNYLDGLLWRNQAEARAFLAARFAEATVFDRGLARALLNLAAGFAHPPDWWPRQHRALFQTLQRTLQADGLDELEPLTHLLAQSDELDLNAAQQACLHCRRGWVLDAADQPLTALDACRQGEALLPNDPTLRARIADLYGRIGWALCLVKEQAVPSHEAEEAFRRALGLQPEAGHLYVGLGVALHGLKRGPEAVTALQQGIELQGEQTSSLNWLGNVYRAQEEYGEALAAYQRAIDLDPADAFPHNGLGNVYSEQKEYGQALAAYQRAIDLDPALAAPHNGLGNVYSEQQEYGQALAAYQRAIDLAPDYAFPHNGLGNVYREQQEYGQALAAYQRAIDLDPADAFPHYGLGVVYREQKEYGQAIAAYGRAIDLDPDDASTYRGRGITYSLLEAWAEAAADYLHALELDPDQGWVYASLAGIYRRQGVEDQYTAFLQEARQRIPPDANYLQACLASIAGEADTAITYLVRALEQDPDDRDWASRDPDFHWIRDDPRYRALVGLVGLVGEDGDAQDLND
jgi:tetratricopeptide (TPR) repeat protein